MKTVLNSVKFLFKSLNHSCYCKEGAMFTCAKEKVTPYLKVWISHWASLTFRSLRPQFCSEYLVLIANQMARNSPGYVIHILLKILKKHMLVQPNNQQTQK